MQIINTLKCNFACRHCLEMCSPRRTEVLDNHALIRFMEKASGYGEDFINYCGGEIFMNPDWKWQIEYLSRQTEHLRIVTNGSKFYTKNGNQTSLLKEFIECLGNIQFNCRISIIISNDEFHQEFYYKKDLYPLESVIRQFRADIPENISYEEDSRWCTNYVIPVGRALKTGCWTDKGSPTCMSFEPCLNANGKVYACCNMRMEVGDVWSGNINTWQTNHEKLVLPQNCLECPYR